MTPEELQSLTKDAPDVHIGSLMIMTRFANIKEDPDVIQNATVSDLIRMFADALPNEQGSVFSSKMWQLPRHDKLSAIIRFAQGSENFRIRDRALELQSERQLVGRQPTEEETQESLEWAAGFQDRHSELFERLRNS